jgi:hypothetical protein
MGNAMDDASKRLDEERERWAQKKQEEQMEQEKTKAKEEGKQEASDS